MSQNTPESSGKRPDDSVSEFLLTNENTCLLYRSSIEVLYICD